MVLYNGSQGIALNVCLVVLSLLHLTLSQDGGFNYRLPQDIGLRELSEKLSKRKSDLQKSELELFSFPDLLLRELVGNNLTSELCVKQINYTFQHLELSLAPNFANKMLDATAKIGPGLLNGRVKLVGDYDECVSVSSYWNSSLDMDYNFDAHYCSATFDNVMGTNGFVGLCLPEGCRTTDLKNLFTYFDTAFNLTIFRKASAQCQPKDVPLSGGAIATIVIYSLMAAICGISTVYDAWLKFLESYERSTNSGEEEAIIQKSPTPVRKHGVFTRLLLCFSLYTNGCKLLNSDKNADSLGCLHGIRFLSMSWVILGHSVSLFLTAITSNVLTPLNWIKSRWSLEVILNATVSVDSFFVMSGLLSVYMMLKQFQNKNLTSKQFSKTVPVMYLHRYIRLTPAYGFMILFWTFIPYFLVNGPFRRWSYEDTILDVNCIHSFWANLLYINNLYKPNAQCAAWGWYLANDFQFFLITPFIAYITIRKEKYGVILNAALVLISIACAIAMDLNYDFGISIYTQQTRDPAHPKHPAGHFHNQYYYMAPYTRYQSYGVGCLFGYLLWKLNRKLTIHWALNLLFIGASGATMLAYLYGPYTANAKTHHTTLFEGVLYNGIGRTAWCLALGYIILICCCGRGGIIDEILSWPGFIPLSRMTYSAYLIHIIVLFALNLDLQNAFFVTEFTVVMSYLAVLVYSYLAAFFFSLLFEAPFMNLDKNFITGNLMKRT